MASELAARIAAKLGRADAAEAVDAELAGVLITEGWRPIAEAPVGEEVLVVCGRAMYLGTLREVGEFWRDDSGHALHGLTHWQPLPAPPSEAAPEEG